MIYIVLYYRVWGEEMLAAACNSLAEELPYLMVPLVECLFTDSASLFPSSTNSICWCALN